MSSVEEKISARVALNGTSPEYEEAYRICKKFSNTMNKAIIGQASKADIEQAIVQMQATLEIVKTMNGSSTSNVTKGVSTLLGIKTEDTATFTPKSKTSSKK